MNDLLLSQEQMKKLSTKRLLNYKRKYLSHCAYASCSLCSGRCEQALRENAKEIAEWDEAHNAMKIKKK